MEDKCGYHCYAAYTAAQQCVLKAIRCLLANLSQLTICCHAQSDMYAQIQCNP